jgi:hypothetical protein
VCNPVAAIFVEHNAGVITGGLGGELTEEIDVGFSEGAKMVQQRRGSSRRRGGLLGSKQRISGVIRLMSIRWWLSWLLDIVGVLAGRASGTHELLGRLDELSEGFVGGGFGVLARVFGSVALLRTVSLIVGGSAALEATTELDGDGAIGF